MSPKNQFTEAQLAVSAAIPPQFPEDIGVEVAFAGRSNVGKSSTINILARHAIAYTSKKPGHTRLINFFNLQSPEQRIVDLPGYGYAKVSIDIKNRWRKTLKYYFNKRYSLRGVILVMDIRHPLTELDLQMLNLARYNNREVHILLTKADKLKRGPQLQALREVAAKLQQIAPQISVQCFSSKTRLGQEEAFLKIANWLEYIKK